MSFLIVTLLAVWFIVSILSQFRYTRLKSARRLVSLVEKCDLFLIVPNCSFFAPYPPNTDMEVLYRDKLRDGELTLWRAMRRRSIPFWKGFWNPDKRRQKILIELSLSLARNAKSHIASRSSGKAMYVSFAYVNLADYIARTAVHVPMTSQTQFMIALSSGFDRRKQPAILFISPFFHLC